ncbi:MAG: DASH family cryptochrome [Alphaproteobacteria bacterium]
MTSIYWFRNDLRLTDNPALAEACEASDSVEFVVIRSPKVVAITPWGFPRLGIHRLKFRNQALFGLGQAIADRGGRLHVLDGDANQGLCHLAEQIHATAIYCEAIAAPEELSEVAALRALGLTVKDKWQSSLLDPADLPFPIDEMPDVFTAFRKAVELGDIAPRPSILQQSPLMPLAPIDETISPSDWKRLSLEGETDARMASGIFEGAEVSGLAHLASYFGSPAPQSYKKTRNQLSGTAFSTKLSPWLATGALSARTVFEHLKGHEAMFGANESTYWIWFELLWRDFFRFWTLKHGKRLFRAQGLSDRRPSSHDPYAFERWCAAKTGHAFVDAGMRELAATGYLSNRMRQIVASYLVHDLGCDWRAGAAWFESQLIDYDVYSNHGNWLYISGRGADPRSDRRFNPDKQARDYDPDGTYRTMWSEPIVGGTP